MKDFRTCFLSLILHFAFFLPAHGLLTLSIEESFDLAKWHMVPVHPESLSSTGSIRVVPEMDRQNAFYRLRIHEWTESEDPPFRLIPFTEGGFSLGLAAVPAHSSAPISFITAHVLTPDGKIRALDRNRNLTLWGDRNFGQVPVGLATHRSLIITNLADDPISVVNIDYPPNFTGNWQGGVLAPQEAKHFTITFAPSTAQECEGQIGITTNALSDLTSITVTGSGVVATLRIMRPADVESLFSVSSDHSSELQLFPPDTGYLIVAFEARSPVGGSVAYVERNKLRYSPPLGFTGLDTFDVIIAAGKGEFYSITANVAVTEGFNSDGARSQLLYGVQNIR